MPSRSRSGFTLLELITAMLLTGLAVLGGILLLDQVTDSAERIVSESVATARENNGLRLLHRLLRDAQTSTDTSKEFVGDERSVEFFSRCDVPGGWGEACRVALAIDERGDSIALLASFTSGEPLVLAHRHGSAEFRYYNGLAKSDSVWLRKWSSNVALPTAIAVLLPNDTVIFPVAGR